MWGNGFCDNITMACRSVDSPADLVLILIFFAHETFITTRRVGTRIGLVSRFTIRNFVVGGAPGNRCSRKLPCRKPPKGWFNNVLRNHELLKFLDAVLGLQESSQHVNSTAKSSRWSPARMFASIIALLYILMLGQWCWYKYCFPRLFFLF